MKRCSCPLVLVQNELGLSEAVFQAVAGLPAHNGRNVGPQQRRVRRNVYQGVAI
eukprot:CAMPEP_0198348740 /NCGR_PEP_ID=MMETSP1450-20131203/91146_1 /TAXON_ID=753684 ORGANISM="Madagascaria erythrocladiodes, Strain CCMP3234" /NCGR_SAMPLE_ID=MMETSP1450 /ASSEMBLY_ACC=CAM_ASM_001115 /LENGTH=53 /DNA_ID=CAMNT_0044054373 /DNA_START=20 /DNA_END=181 /DNA_ORIENTATION=+